MIDENILGFPQSCVVNKNVAKKAFYSRGEQRARLKDWLTHSVEAITWLYKLTDKTANVADGAKVHEIDVFLIECKDSAQIDLRQFAAIDSLLPRHTMFVVRRGESVSLLIHHKELYTDAHGEKKWRCGDTELLSDVDLSETDVRLEGNDMDAVYVGLLRLVSGLGIGSAVSYGEAAEKRARLKRLNAQAASLKKSLRSERQYNKQVEINKMLKEVKRQISEL
ncbi:MAG: DUF4391 domain-containing protein [Prevotella sp.]|nr:DUF4391 domain-containing protein [Prevotella sp.]